MVQSRAAAAVDVEQLVPVDVEQLGRLVAELERAGAARTTLFPSPSSAASGRGAIGTGPSRHGQTQLADQLERAVVQAAFLDRRDWAAHDQPVPVLVWLRRDVDVGEEDLGERIERQRRTVVAADIAIRRL